MKKKRKCKMYGLSKLILLSCCFILFFKVEIIRANTYEAVAFQQNKIVTGRVVDANGIGLLGVNIILKGTGIGAMTDDDGNFSISVKEGKDTLLFSFVGMKDKEVQVAGKTNLQVTMEEDIGELDEVVLIGYQSVQKKTVTSAMTTIKSKEIENRPYASVDQILAGKIAGLSSLSISGEPGASTITNIRGSNSVVLGGVSHPLYVIDGMIYDVNDLPGAYGTNPLAAINPNEIESIDVLKDASAAAIYGSRGANGVILIKTKTAGTSKKPAFRFNTYMGSVRKPTLRTVTTGRLERELKLDLIDGYYKSLEGSYATPTISPFLTDSLNVAFNNNTDWQEMLVQNSLIQNADASLSGSFGENNNQYRVSLGYYKEDGVIKGYGMTRISPKVFLSLNPNKKVNLTTTFAPSFTSFEHGLGSGNVFPFSTWSFPSSFWKITDKQKSLYRGEGTLDEDKITDLLSNTRLNFKFTDDLMFTSSFSYTYRSNRRDYLQSAATSWNGRNIAESWQFETNRWEIENYLTYNKAFGDHNLSVIGGQQASGQSNKSAYIRGIGGLGGTIFGIPQGNDLFAETKIDNRKRLGVFGRASYDYKQKYLFSTSYRRDASTRYNQYKRWTDFYSFSLGWNIADEAFFSNLTNTINLFKLRGSYGVTGNDRGGYYAQYNIYKNDARYYGSSFGVGNEGYARSYNGTIAVGQNYLGAAGDKNITWEKYPQVNIGFDMSLFNNRIEINADWYARDGQDLFYDNLIAPTTSGYKNYSGNVIDIRNTGFEVTLNTRNFSNSSTFQWNTHFNIGINDNYITKLPNGGKDITIGAPWLQYTLTKGKPIYEYRVWESDGVFRTLEEIPTDPLTGKKMTYEGSPLKVGDPKYLDKNGDYNIDANDKVNGGNANIKVSGGFTNEFVYKNWSLSVFCNFITGRKIWNGYVSDALNGTKTSNPARSWTSTAGPALLTDIDYYTVDNPNAEYGALIRDPDIDRFHIANSKFIEDASFLRIKNISLGYVVPKEFANKLQCSSLRFYGMADNVLLLTNSTLPDPEAVDADGHTTGNNYPLALKLTLGLIASF
ncbi:SusC/RagA family TonB-linked outer membrane protein [Thalassobellus citreus]|uniref:SusC/RagA family TonB-linked outer membrane protein n=1 Tax=Thalassobellus citreus TaxID=3367752 RepID=UPI0037B07C82